MTLPREVLPGRFYLITRSCTQRQFLLRPDDATNNGFTYCLAEAANRFRIDVLLVVAMSNHYHAVVYDAPGVIPQFTEHFHKMFAKCQNALRGRWENFWSSEQVCVVRLVDREDVMRKLVYTATNPVKDDLVERAHQWPGVTGFPALLNDKPLRARRPRHFFRAEGKMPDAVELRLTIPAELGRAAEVLRELRERVATAELEASTARRQRGARVLGKRAVLNQSWRASTADRVPRRNLRPLLAARSVWRRLEAILRNREFIDAYREARMRWATNRDTSFPPGTYWLRRFANVAIAS